LSGSNPKAPGFAGGYLLFQERRLFDIPKLIEKPVEVSRPAQGPLSETLPPKTPDRAEQKFINRPDYQAADFNR
jgi:hypothetical protein